MKMKLRKRATRAQIIIKGEASCLESIKSEKASQQLENTLYKPHKKEVDDKNISSLKIKQEDTKDDTMNILKSAAEMEDEGDFYIKQEDIVKKEGIVDAIYSKGVAYRCRICKTKFDDYKSAMHHRESVHNTRSTLGVIKHKDLEPSINDPNKFCRSCEKTYTSKRLYHQHLRNSHYMYVELKRVGPFSNEVPDPRDPNFHCLSCKKTYSSKKAYTHHLDSIHDIRVPPLRRTSIKKADLLPDWNDLTYYCRSCEHQYSSKALFRAHCKKIHSMKSPNRQKYNERELPDLHDPNYYCKVCGITLNNEQSYRSHCYKVHGMRMISSGASNQITNLNNQCSICEKSFTVRNSLNKHLFIFHKMDNDSAPKSRYKKPLVNDPNNYCRICGKTYATKDNYRFHLITIHSIKDKRTQKEKQQPDVDDPNNYCRVCQRTYTSRPNYRVHLIRIHQVISRRPIAYDPNCFPDPLDPNGYCCVCKTYYKDQHQYRQHCKSAHRMKFNALRQVNVNPNAEINTNDPDHYCAKCDRKLSSRYNFLAHIQRIHGTKMSPKPTTILGPTIDPNHPK